jgi:two-component system, OmpR family, copper resistance phosphate regulon response regulator CusR
MIGSALAPGARILVIAEDQLFAERCRRGMEAAGHQVQVAPGWWIGVHLAGLQAPDLVVVDELLADLDGLSVLAILKAHPTTSSLPVVVAASRERADLQLRAGRLGAAAIALKADLGAGRVDAYLRPSKAVPAS